MKMLPDFHPVCVWPSGIVSVFMGKSLFFSYSFIFCGSWSVTLSFLEVFINILRAIALLGDARAAGAEARCAGAPKSIHGRRATGTHG